MSYTVVLAEKPSVARDLARVLKANKKTPTYMEGNGYIVTWALGHLVTLADPEVYDPKYKTWQLNDLPMLPEKMKLTVIKQTMKQFKAVTSLLKRADVNEIVIATDAGREGELVARWIIQLSGVKKPMKRLWISSITDKAIQEGFRNLVDARKYQHLFEAAVARAEADWYVGLNITRALTTKHNAQLNSGRVQTPVVAMIAQREQQIREFQPKTYYGLKAVLAHGLSATWYRGQQANTFDQSLVHTIIKQSGNVTHGTVKEVKRKQKKKSAPALFDLTELQREAYQQFGFSAKETLSICQRLYEQYKILTYPRTDSRYLSTDMVDTIQERVQACIGIVDRSLFKKHSIKVTEKHSMFNNQKVSDHHAIIPTEQSVNLTKLSDKELKIYRLVVQRFLANLMSSQESEEVVLTLEIAKEKFVLKETVMTQPGWTALYGESINDKRNQWIEQAEVGSRCEVYHLEETSGQTKPPAYFNEATLLTAMENPTAFMQGADERMVDTIRKTGGLGTVATRADIIEKLFNSFMIEKRGENIVTTGKGKQLLELVPEAMRSPELTSQWEMKLEQIATGKLKKAQFINEIKHYTKELVQTVKVDSSRFKHDNLTTKRCPNCDKPMLAVNGKKGKMLVCQDRECGTRKHVSRLTNARCPQCKKKLELVGEGDGQRFVCGCGYREKLSAFQARRQKEGNGKADKRSVQQYMKQQAKETPNNSVLFAALSQFKQD